jgi:hypothetical protein
VTIYSAPRCVEPTQCHEFKANNDSVGDLDEFPYLEHVENIAYSVSQSPSPPLPQIELYPGTGAVLHHSIAKLWEPDAHGGLEMNLQNSPSYLFATCEEYQYVVREQEDVCEDIL